MIYFDNQTCAQPTDKVIKAVAEGLKEYWGVPGTPHQVGQRVLSKMEEAYRKIYRLFNMTEEESFIFTSSGAEAINQVIFSTYMDLTRETGKNHFLTSAGDEAPSILAMERLLPFGCSTDMIPLDHSGVVSPKALSEAITPRSVLLSLSIANGMTGVLQPVEELAKVCRERGVRLHLDITSSIGKLYLDWDEIQPDYLTFNGEQLHAPSGTGGLFILKNRQMSPLIIGGNDQNGMRAGSINVANLLALGEAAAELDAHQDYFCTEVIRLRDHFEITLKEHLPFIKIFFQEGERLPNVTVVSFPGVSSDALLYALSKEGVYASFGGGNFQQIGLLLQACHVENHLAQCALHFCFSYLTTQQEIDDGVKIITDVVTSLKRTSEFLQEK